MKHDNETHLLKRIRNASPGSDITVEDITTVCTNQDELLDCIFESFKRNISIRFIKQPWLDSSNNDENAFVLMVRLSKLFKKTV